MTYQPGFFVQPIRQLEHAHVPAPQTCRTVSAIASTAPAPFVQSHVPSLAPSRHSSRTLPPAAYSAAAAPSAPQSSLSEVVTVTPAAFISSTKSAAA